MKSYSGFGCVLVTKNNNRLANYYLPEVNKVTKIMSTKRTGNNWLQYMLCNTTSMTRPLDAYDVLYDDDEYETRVAPEHARATLPTSRVPKLQPHKEFPNLENQQLIHPRKFTSLIVFRPCTELC